MRTSHNIQRLAALELFAGCTPKELETIASLATERTVAAGDQIVRQGAMGYDCFVVVEGSAVVERGGEVVATIGAGEFVGEITVLDHQPRSATVTALDEVHLLVLGHKDLAAALTKVPVLVARLATLMAERQASSAASVAERLAHAGERLASL